MADSRYPPLSDEMLEAVTESMVELHERHYGRKPTKTHSKDMGDGMLACMFGEPYTDVEKTLIELQRQALVHESRTTFQQAMEPRFISRVEKITRRRVDRFISTHHVGPDLEVELFVLGPVEGYPTNPCP